jgi:hypothetical protein
VDWLRLHSVIADLLEEIGRRSAFDQARAQGGLIRRDPVMMAFVRAARTEGSA